MSFDFVSHLRKKTDGSWYIPVPAGVEMNAPAGADVKIHGDILLVRVKRDGQSPS